MWNFAIPAICVIAHVYLVLLFLPAFWREIDQRGFRWHNAFSLFVVPALVGGLIAYRVLTDLDSMPDWLVIVGFVTIDALIVVMVLAAVGLWRRRKLAA